MVRTLFGTDGIRGKVNSEPMVPATILKLGQAAARVFAKKKNAKIIIAKDTRASGYIFEYALTSGLCSMGIDVYQVGPLPTPALAHLVKSFGAQAGIMISASHNPAGDNGIKFFGPDGFKLSDEIEEAIEKEFFAKKPLPQVPAQNLGKAYKIEDARGRYIEFVKQGIKNRSLAKFKVVIDCANGAAYKVAPWILKELGAQVIVLNNTPDGLNINKNAGSEHPTLLQKAVKQHSADIGIALDGDADRVLLVDETGKIVSAEALLGIAALHFKGKGKLDKGTVVTTVMSNAGFDAAMNKHGVHVVRTAVGDRYIMEEMRKHGYTLGGEQSGHIIFSKQTTTGDGTVAALQMLSIMIQKKQKLSVLAKCVTLFPQVLINVDVKKKTPLKKLPKTMDAIKKAQEAIGNSGRVLVRYSGTQNLCRVMVEAKDKKMATNWASKIAQTIKGN